MRILLAGDWHSELHEEPVFRALSELGHDVHRFAWHGYFANPVNGIDSMLMKMQNKYLAGPRIQRLNTDLLNQATEIRPDLLFIYRGTHVLPHTLQTLHRVLPRTLIAGYNNDDPFAPNQPRWLWRHFIACLPEYDAALAYRPHNLDDFSSHGARNTYLLRSWFVPERNHPATLAEDEIGRFSSDVVFVGHYENDGRLELLESVVKAGHKLRLFGPGYDWDPVLAGSPWLRDLRPVQLVWGDDYNKALCGSKVALCFLSRLNRDTYTRRCFEIPATGTLMLSEHSNDLSALFREGVEAEFFRSERELLAKLDTYVRNDALRRNVAAAGMARVHNDGHDVRSRLDALIAWMEDTLIRNGRHHAA